MFLSTLRCDIIWHHFTFNIKMTSHTACGCTFHLYFPRVGTGYYLTWVKQRSHRSGVLEYKNLSWVWGWDRKICPEDHRMASRGLPSDGNWWSRGTDFSIPTSHELWILFLAHHLIPYLSWKNLKKAVQKVLNTLRCDMVTSFKHYNDVTDRRVASVRLFVFYLSLGLVWVCEIEISHMGKNNGNLDLVCEKILSIPG